MGKITQWLLTYFSVDEIINTMQNSNPSDPDKTSVNHPGSPVECKYVDFVIEMELISDIQGYL